MRTIDFYRFPNGKCPVEEFLNSLSGKQAQKILWVLQLIEETRFVPRQYFKKLIGRNDIWEVRIQFGNDIFRLLGFFKTGDNLVLTNGFVKKTPKTPGSDIEIAYQRMEEYLTRK